MPRSTGTAHALQISEDVVPIAEFKARLSAWVRDLPARGRPVVVTQNGRPAAVVLAPAEFDRLANRARFVASVREGLEDVEAGRVVSDEAVGRLLEERYGPLPKGRSRRR